MPGGERANAQRTSRSNRLPRRVFKYRGMGGNRYGLRVTVENGAVVGWDEKD